MKNGYRFVDCDMHIMEPPDLFDKYLDPEFKPRVTSSLRRMEGGATGMRGRPTWYFDGQPLSNDGNVSQYNRTRGPLVSQRANTTVLVNDGQTTVIGGIYQSTVKLQNDRTPGLGRIPAGSAPPSPPRVSSPTRSAPGA